MSTPITVAVIGGGINGLCTAWQLSENGYEVELYERGRLLGETSSASSKLLHGGLRYLENLEFRLVREALHERDWWLRHVPEHTNILPLCLPVYTHGTRPLWLIKCGLLLYDILAGSSSIGRHKQLSATELMESFPDLDCDGLVGGFIFFDGQMDEQGLGSWVAGKAREAGAKLHEHVHVDQISLDGSIRTGESSRSFDCVINTAGPWAAELLRKSAIEGGCQLDLIRGSHLVVNRPASEYGYLLEIPGEERVFFVLPYRGKTLIGTTEVRQTLAEPIACDDHEVGYLLNAYNHYFHNKLNASDVLDVFAGVRPLIQSASDPGKTTREYLIESRGKLVNVYGGKWTTARALAKNVVKEVRKHYGIYRS